MRGAGEQDITPLECRDRRIRRVDVVGLDAYPKRTAAEVVLFNESLIRSASLPFRLLQPLVEPGGEAVGLVDLALVVDAEDLHLAVRGGEEDRIEGELIGAEGVDLELA